MELHITIKIAKYAEDAVDCAVYLVKACVIGGELGVSNVEFSNVIEALDKVMVFSYKFQFGFVQLCWNWDVGGQFIVHNLSFLYMLFLLSFTLDALPW